MEPNTKKLTGLILLVLSVIGIFAGVGLSIGMTKKDLFFVIFPLVITSLAFFPAGIALLYEPKQKENK